MTLHISIEYRTNWGEEIVLCLGGKRYPLAYVADGLWQGEIARFNPEKHRFWSPPSFLHALQHLHFL